jgi:hypothetical protein
MANDKAFKPRYTYVWEKQNEGFERYEILFPFGFNEDFAKFNKKWMNDNKQYKAIAGREGIGVTHNNLINILRNAVAGEDYKEILKRGGGYTYEAR